MYDGRVRLYGLPLSLPQNPDEVNVAEEMSDKFFSPVLVFVGCHCGNNAGCGNLPQHFRYSRVWKGHVAFVAVVEGEEEGCHFLYRIFVSPAFGNSPAEQIVDSASAQRVIVFDGPFRESAFPQGVVGGAAEVFHRVQQGAVKVEYCKFCHFFGKIFTCAMVWHNPSLSLHKNIKNNEL